jgi:flagellar motility protein MotE (MotC chaperone)
MTDQTSPLRLRRLLLAGAFALLAPTTTLAEGSSANEPGAVGKPVDTGPKQVRVIGEDGKPIPPEVAVQSDVERYCSAIADPAKDQRIALQTERLKQLEAEVGAKIDELEAKRQEYQGWLEQRQAFLDSTSAIMVDIYAKMKPDAAAAQLASIDREMAASVLTKLKSRTASGILSEMPPGVASELAALIVKKTSKDGDVAAQATKPGAKS